MKQYFFFGALFLVTLFPATAQVGINTTDPKAQLDIAIEDPGAPGATDGILIPRISRFPAAQPTVAQNGMMVFLDTSTENFPVGFYYWNSTGKEWKGIGQEASSDFYRVGTTSAAASKKESIFRTGNVNIGGEAENVKLKVILPSSEDHAIRTGFEVENASSSPKNVTYGIISSNRSVTADKKYGIKNLVSADGTGIHYGIFNETYQNTNEEIYGIYNDVGKTFGATKNHYGIYNKIGTIQGNGTVYGIYSTAAGNDPRKVFAGYFAGRLGIGATPAEEYILPDVRGTQDQVLMTDGNGLVTWRHPNAKTYTSTTSSTGSYLIPDETYTLRINDQVSSITIPDAATNKGRIIYLINWPGNSFKTFTFLNGNDLFDVTTNSTVSGINGSQKMMIQSAGNRWILLDK
ncbi:hypothetical protein [Salinimicrobium flavum]|uniref:Uncharacterized protein n=1 Tax=Salinimicrobium flavum TaxID=1737065 RepID=A0ABW5ITR5_9FLAO